VKFLNGWKTILGIVGTVVTVGVGAGGDVGAIASKVGEFAGNADAVVTGAFGMLTVLGVAHKLEKRAGK
jgi:hypothetical protein